MTESAKLTRNQKIVFSALTSSQTPLTAYEILGLEDVRGEGLTAPLTIYRALQKLRALGLAHRIESLNAFVACDHAPHLEPVGFAICERCRCSVELRLRDCENHLLATADLAGFEVGTVKVELLGLCRRCQDTSKVS